MSEYESVRCLFCTTGKEENVVRLIHEYEWGRALFPQRIRTVLKNGEWAEIPTPLLPGYVFVYSGADDVHSRDLWSIRDVVRTLRYSDGTEALIGPDLEFAQWLWQLGGRIEVMKAAQVGDRIEIIDGVFKRLHGTITKMDKRRRTVRVMLETVGTPKQIWLAYEIVERRDAEGGERRGDKCQ